MTKFLCTVACIISLQSAFSQTTTPTTDSTVTLVQTLETPDTKKDWRNFDMSNRSNDHFMIQFGIDGWSGQPDSVSPSGFSRHFNAYFMLDKPFKTNPKLSVAFGVGVGSSNMFFKRTSLDVKSNAATLPIRKLDSAEHFKKYKLTTAYLEAPVELRFSSNPLNNNKSVKLAIGAKVGTLINVHTKGKTLEDKAGNTINAYTMKESSKRFFNSTKLAGTVRVGYGIFSLHGQYTITSLLKDGVGPEIHPYAVGLTISGL
jgi:hypothetical protein